jgi:predicted transcriptional regulator
VTTPHLKRRHVSMRIPEDTAAKVDELASALRKNRPSWIPSTCELSFTDVAVLAMDRGLTLLGGSVRDGKG